MVENITEENCKLIYFLDRKYVDFISLSTVEGTSYYIKSRIIIMN